MQSGFCFGLLNNKSSWFVGADYSGSSRMLLTADQKLGSPCEGWPGALARNCEDGFRQDMLDARELSWQDSDSVGETLVCRETRP